MKSIVLIFPILLVIASGCTRTYVMKLNNGLSITTSGKPTLKGSSYYFKNAAGQTVSIPAGRVSEIEPASMAKEEKESFKAVRAR